MATARESGSNSRRLTEGILSDILGISCFYHDAAAALIRDGVLVAAAEEERFTRKKHDSSFPEQAIKFCLQKGEIRGEDLDYAVFYEKPLLKFERILMTTLAGYPKTSNLFSEAMIGWLKDKLWIRGLIVRKLGLPANRVLFTEHHLSHAASAFFCSPFESAAILTIDGVGEWTTATLGYGRASWSTGDLNKISLVEEIRFPNSLGLIYSAFTSFLGFEVNEGEYKVMGMAPYGKPKYIDDVFEMVQVNSDGSFRLDMDYFDFHKSTEHSYSQKFIDLFGPPRIPNEDFYTQATDPRPPRWDERIAKDNQKYADIAASIQLATEEIVLKMANHAYESTRLENLCLAGGVALNSVANGRILRESPFKDIYIQPASGDSGGALGAALYAYHVLMKKPRTFVMENSYWGASYSDCAPGAVKRGGFSFEEFDDESKMIERVVDGLLKGQVVGWFRGRFEWGPRALGNRSIIADPRRLEMKTLVNEKIKFREPFRPFAPVVLEQDCEAFFDLPHPEKHYPARFMILVVPIQQNKTDTIQAVNHFGTARVQTIRREINPLYYRAIEMFGEATGVPILLNTSFNLRGEPIVATPQDALATFAKSGLDLLVMENMLVKKKI
jgi:carbamoyltransferase